MTDFALSDVLQETLLVFGKIVRFEAVENGLERLVEGVVFKPLRVLDLRLDGNLLMGNVLRIERRTHRQRVGIRLVLLSLFVEDQLLLLREKDVECLFELRKLLLNLLPHLLVRMRLLLQDQVLLAESVQLEDLLQQRLLVFDAY